MQIKTFDTHSKTKSQEKRNTKNHYQRFMRVQLLEFAEQTMT